MTVNQSNHSGMHQSEPEQGGADLENTLKERDFPNNEENFVDQITAVTEEKIQEKTIYAGFWLRFWAYLIDLVVVMSLDSLLIKPIFRAFNISQYDLAVFSPITIGSAVVFYLYFVLMTKFLGQTLGKMVLGLKVVSLKEGSLSWGTVIFRELIGRFIVRTLLYGISYILVGIFPKKQGLHDLFADTSVVLEKKR